MRIDSMVETDRNLVLNSWTKSYRLSIDLPTDEAALLTRSRIDRILARPGTIVLVSREPKNPLFVFGWGCFERVGDAFVAHYVYVKSHFRQQHHARALLHASLTKIGSGATKLLATHKTYADNKELEQKVRDLGFVFVSPEALYRQEAA